MIKVGLHLPEKWWHKTRYELLEDIRVQQHTIPKGFITDGATVPRLLWPIFPPTGRYLSAAVLHDYLLVTRDRRSADLEFNRVMKQLKIEAWRRKVMFVAVRSFSIYKEFLASS